MAVPRAGGATSVFQERTGRFFRSFLFMGSFLKAYGTGRAFFFQALYKPLSTHRGWGFRELFHQAGHSSRETKPADQHYLLYSVRLLNNLTSISKLGGDKKYQSSFGIMVVQVVAALYVSECCTSYHKILLFNVSFRLGTLLQKEPLEPDPFWRAFGTGFLHTGTDKA